MHSNNFVVAVRHNGQFIKESVGGVVALPFGAEYQIRLRNKHNRRAVAKVYIDEENISEGGIVVNANSFVDLDCHVASLKKFKFVSSDSGEAIDAGKNNPTDDANGLVRVEWRLEKVFTPPIYMPTPVPYWINPYPYKRYFTQPTWTAGARGQSAKCGGFSAQNCASPSVGVNTDCRRLSEGCTVEGTLSDQRFTNTWLDLEVETTIITLTLRGYNVRPTNHKGNRTAVYCENCGARIRSKASKFCSNCGARQASA